MKSKLTGRGGLIIGMRLINNDDFVIYTGRKEYGKNGIAFDKIIFDDKKGYWKWNHWCTTVKVHCHIENGQVVFCNKIKLNLSIFSEKDSLQQLDGEVF